MWCSTVNTPDVLFNFKSWQIPIYCTGFAPIYCNVQTLQTLHITIYQSAVGKHPIYFSIFQCWRSTTPLLRSWLSTRLLQGDFQVLHSLSPSLTKADVFQLSLEQVVRDSGPCWCYLEDNFVAWPKNKNIPSCVSAFPGTSQGFRSQGPFDQI